MDKRRKWFSVVLEEGLRLGVFEPEDILHHVTPSVLATDLPPKLLAEVLEVGIGNQDFNPQLVVETLGPDNLAEHIPLPVLWNCLNSAATLIVDEHPLTKESAGDSSRFMVDPDSVQPGDNADIEVIES